MGSVCALEYPDWARWELSLRGIFCSVISRCEVPEPYDAVL